MLALILAVALSVAPPNFVAVRSASSVSELLAANAVPIATLRVDLSGDGHQEIALLVGRPGPTGALYPVGLIVARELSKSPPQVRLVASAPFRFGSVYDAQFGTDIVDLDGDGRPELTVQVRSVGPQIKDHGTTWWRLDGSTLRPIYQLQNEWTTRHGRELRTMKVTAPGRIEEGYEREEDGKTVARLILSLRFDPLVGRFLSIKAKRAQ